MKQQRILQNFEVILEPEEDGGYHIFCPALKGCHTCGGTKEEAMEKIKEAIEIWLESARELGIEMPERVTVRVETK